MKKQKAVLKTILFDLEGTLIKSTPFHIESFYLILRNYSSAVSRKKIRSVISYSSEEIYRKLKAKKITSLSLNKFLNKRRKQYFSLVKGKNLLFPQTLPLIKELKKRFLQGIVTNSSRITTNKSTSQKFRKLFRAIITWSDVKKGKPDKEPVIKALKALKVKAGECIFVGDSLDDALAAKRAKVKFIGVTTGLTSGKKLKKAGAFAVVSNLAQTAKIIK